MVDIVLVSWGLSGILWKSMSRDGPPPVGGGRSRNGTSTKTVQTDVGPVTIDVPRDRDGSFDR